MKKRIISHIALIPLVWLLLMTACQEPVLEVEEPSKEEGFTVGDPLADLIRRVVLIDGSFDNIVDRASCISILMPYEVRVNGQLLTIETAEDYATVEAILDMSNADKDTIAVQFPVSVRSPYYADTLVEQQTVFESIQAECTNEWDEDIECIDFIYPVSMSVYNDQTESATTESVSTDQEMYEFLESLNENEFVGIKFPILMLASDGQSQEVADHLQLENLLDNAIDGCDERDALEDIGNPEPLTLEEILKIGTWRVAYYFDEKDTTVAFKDYVFGFEADEVLQVIKDNETYNGGWSVEIEEEDGKEELKLAIDFDEVEEPLEWLEEEWEVTEYTTEKVEMKAEGEDDEELILIIEKI